MTDAGASSEDIARVFREQHGRAIAVLVRSFGDIDLAEEAVGEAFAAAAAEWPHAGLPPSPAGWVLTTARHRAVDRLRRDAARESKHRHATFLLEQAVDEADEEGTVDDDRLRLVFTCCHPALAIEAQVALTLRLLGGLSTAEIARAFLVSEATMAQRLVRAKGKIRDARIPYRVPDAGELPGRVRSALAVVYLVFNEGYAATSGPHLVRDDLCREAIRLGRVLHELMPGDMEVVGLLALMLLLQSRRAARVSASGELVSLREQDRAHWDRELVAEGQALVRRCLAANRPGPYQLQAAVSAVHADATRAADTDWGQILALYDHMMQLAPSPIVALNRAVAVAEVHGPDAALDAIAGLDLPAYPLFHAVRADFLARVGRTREACQEYDTAIGITENAVERAFLVRERAKVVLDGRPWKVD